MSSPDRRPIVSMLLLALIAVALAACSQAGASGPSAEEKWAASAHAGKTSGAGPAGPSTRCRNSSSRPSAALAASLFHYKQLAIDQVKAYLAQRGVPVRR